MKFNLKNIIPWVLLVAVLVLLGVVLFKKSSTGLNDGAANVLASGATISAPIWYHFNDGEGNCWDESWEKNGATGLWERSAKTVSYPCAVANSGPTGILAVYMLDVPTVSYIQTAFVKNNYMKTGGYITGKMDSPTVAAVKSFQQKNKLPVNGWVDYRTKEAIYLLK